MQRATLVRYTVKSGRAAENEALSRRVFAELHECRPDAVAYALLRNEDEFIHVFVNLQADDSASVTELPSFKAFERDLVERCEIRPEVTRLAANMIENYGFASSR